MPNTSEDIVYKHLNAINAQDKQGYLDSVKFPFTYQNYNGVSITIKDEEDYKVNYNAMEYNKGYRGKLVTYGHG